MFIFKKKSWCLSISLLFIFCCQRSVFAKWRSLILTDPILFALVSRTNQCSWIDYLKVFRIITAARESWWRDFYLRYKFVKDVYSTKNGALILCVWKHCPFLKEVVIYYWGLGPTWPHFNILIFGNVVSVDFCLK